MKKVYLCPTDDYTPIIEIGSDDSSGSIVATYYDDLSGEICLTDYDGEEFFFKDDGRLTHHIEYLEEAMKKDKKEAQIILNRKLALYKKAILLLKKEQTKAKKNKNK